MKENQKEQKKRAPRFGQRKVQVKIKKLREDAVIPSYAHDTDCGMDLTAVSKTNDEYGNVVYGFGLAFEIPEGYAGFIFPRSSNHKSRLLLTNSVGIVDSGYRGEVTVKFAQRTSVSVPAKFWSRIKLWLLGKLDDGCIKTWEACNSNNHKVGDRVAQMVILPYPKVQLEVVEELSNTERGEGGYGSTGK